MVGSLAFLLLILFLVLFTFYMWVISLGTLIGQYQRRKVLSLKHVHLILIPLLALTLYFCFEVSKSSHFVFGGVAAAGKKCITAFMALLIFPYTCLLLYRRYQTARPNNYELTHTLPLFQQRGDVRHALTAAAIGVVLTIAVFVIEFGPSRLLTHSARQNDIRLVKLLTDLGADVNVKDRLGGHSPLWFACRNGNLEMVKLFLSNAADLEFSSPVSLISIASYHGRTEIVRLLLDKGIDVNCKDSHGQTALISAAQGAATEVAKLLVERGADVNAESIHGATALIYACDKNDISVARFLLESGANPNVKAAYGDSPMIHAVRRNNTELVRLLKTYGAKDLK